MTQHVRALRSLLQTACCCPAHASQELQLLPPPPCFTVLRVALADEEEEDVAASFQHVRATQLHACMQRTTLCAQRSVQHSAHSCACR